MSVADRCYRAAELAAGQFRARIAHNIARAVLREAAEAIEERIGASNDPDTIWYAGEAVELLREAQ